jgi:hypothetical protein
MNCSYCGFPNPAPVFVAGSQSQHNEQCPICGHWFPQNLESIFSLKREVILINNEIEIEIKKLTNLGLIFNALINGSKDSKYIEDLTATNKLYQKCINNINAYIKQRDDVEQYINTLLQKNIELEEKNAEIEKEDAETDRKSAEYIRRN